MERIGMMMMMTNRETEFGVTAEQKEMQQDPYNVDQSFVMWDTINIGINSKISAKETKVKWWQFWKWLQFLKWQFLKWVRK